MIVTREFLNEWKRSERIVFHHDQTGRLGTTEEFSGCIRFCRESKVLGVDIEARYNLPSMILRDYTTGSREWKYAFAMRQNYKTDQWSEMRGIAEALRVGDQISLFWYPDGASNEYARNAGLHGDMLRLRVVRGKRTFAYLLDRQICADNSARMIRSELYGGL